MTDRPWWFKEDAGLTLDDWGQIHEHCPILAKLHAMSHFDAVHYQRVQPDDERHRQIVEQMSIQRMFVARAVIAACGPIPDGIDSAQLAHDWTYRPGQVIRTIEDAL